MEHLENTPQPTPVEATPAAVEQQTAEAELEAQTAEMPDEAEAAADVLTIEDDAPHAPLTKQDIIERLQKVIADDGADIAADELARLKQEFYRLRTDEQRQERQQWVDAGNDPEAFMPALDPAEEQLKEALNTIRERKAEMRRRLEEQQQDNLRRKRAIIEELGTMAGDTDNVNRHFTRARELQTEFLAIGNVPDTDSTAVWKEYQEARERFYDQLKINKELRDYDFKKNLAEKELLCDEAEKLLTQESDIITAFRRLQDLHDKWRQIGPVAKELRQDIWMRFKDASAEINKRYQAHFEERKAREAENESAKVALCEKVEALDWSELRTYAAWDDMTKVIVDLQAQWKTLGFASRKTNNLLFARFRGACDAFFNAKAAFFRTMKETQADNLARKTALCERAEAIKDSDDWRVTTEEMVSLQKEWKTIGPVPRKQSDAIWTRFMAACDAFFDRKKQNTSGVRHTEQANLRLKQEILDKLAAMTAPDAPSLTRDEAVAALAELRSQWNEIGHVPFKMKDKIYDTFRDLLRQAEVKYDLRQTRARREAFERRLNDMEGDSNSLFREREKILRALEQRRSELNTYENNLGFLSFKSGKGENPLMREMKRRMQQIKDDIAALKQKITLLDSRANQD